MTLSPRERWALGFTLGGGRAPIAFPSALTIMTKPTVRER